MELPILVTVRSTKTNPALDWSQLAVHTSRLPDALSSMLEQALLQGLVPVGGRLPSERDLATQLGVSRASVREAIHELVLKGLVARRSGRGTVVVDADGRGLGDSLLGVMLPASRDFRTILDFREAIEPPITGRAALRATPADIRNLAAALAEMETVRSRADYALLDRRFHYLVARATHNPLLSRLVEVTAEWMASIRKESLEGPRRRTASLAGHRAILDAIIRHDAPAAAAATVAHVQQIGSIVTHGKAASSDPAQHSPGSAVASAGPQAPSTTARPAPRRLSR
jgi:GntR family transcriptional regulator, transcriptional repressor for pyruvate dehydrogenase complex